MCDKSKIWVRLTTFRTTLVYIYIYIDMCIYISSSSSCRVASTDALSRHFSLLFVASSSSGLHPVSSHSCCMYVLAGRPAFARPYVWVHRSKSRMSASLHLQQCPACLVRLTWIVFVIGGRWPCEVFPPGLGQYCSQYSCVIAV